MQTVKGMSPPAPFPVTAGNSFLALEVFADQTPRLHLLSNLTAQTPSGMYRLNKTAWLHSGYQSRQWCMYVKQFGTLETCF